MYQSSQKLKGNTAGAFRNVDGWIDGWMVEQKEVVSHTHIYTLIALPFACKHISSPSSVSAAMCELSRSCSLHSQAFDTGTRSCRQPAASAGTHGSRTVTPTHFISVHLSHSLCLNAPKT